MSELSITPSGHLSLRDAPSEAGPVVSAALVEAYRASAVQGLLLSAIEEQRVLPPSFDFARTFARLYLTALCKAATGAPGEAVPELVPPLAELEALVIQAPPMVGLEYLNAEVLSGWWQELDDYTRAEIAKHPEGPQGYLRERNPQWRFVGRVTLHLAENKRNSDYPFAFLATYANGLTPQGQVKHEPLGQALQQYAGEKKREAMIALLRPLSLAAETSDWMKSLVDSGQIYHPLAWAPSDAYRLLQSIPQLESCGVIVRVPNWWNAQKPSRPRVSVKVNSKNPSSLGVDALLDFSVDVSLNGVTLSTEEMQQLLTSSGGLVPLRGQWIEVDHEKLQAALKHWKQVEKDSRTDGMTFFAGMRLLSGVRLGSDGSDDATAEVREWTGLTAGPELNAMLEQLRSPETTQEAAPPGLKAELRPYQQTGFAWLRFTTRLGLGACLADDMGLGKTIQVISLLLDLKRDGRKRASLLIVPASLIANWRTELRRFAPSLVFGVAHASEGNASVSEATADALDVVITTYGMMTRTTWLKSHAWRLAILDETQAIKNSGTKQTRAIKELQAESRIALTGTPVENRLSDLWSLFDFLNPGLLGTAKQFRTFVSQLQNSATASYEPLRKLVKPYILRRLKTDKRVISDLPDKTELKAYCTLTKPQAALYQNAVNELQAQLQVVDGTQRRGIVLASLMRFKQICNHPAQVTGSQDYAADLSGKFQRLAEIVESIAAKQEKVLVFTQFREIAEPLSAFLATLFGRTGLLLHGGTTVKKRAEFVKDFQREDGPPHFVLSLKAGGTGLNLTAASHVIHFDRWWNPAVENQATDRAFRIGQKRNVLVHKFLCQGTVEERIDEMIAKKSEVANEVIGGDGAGEVLLTEMDNATLLDFVKLDWQDATTE
jgi:superfamily II DNA or RNA helicase